MGDAVDLHWLGRPHRIAAWRVGDVLVDCGPATTLPRLLDELGDWRPRALLLTHIHFDHGGAAGALVRRWPDLEVHVHHSGARHLAAPERLEASARRVFGDAFDARFGPLVPVPEENLRPLSGGERLHGLEVLEAPGHAGHHVVYLDGSGCAYVGDLAGVRLRDGAPLIPPTPPPDIALDAWLASLDLLAARGPKLLALAHYGHVVDPERHLAAVREELTRHAALVRSGVGADAYARTVRAWLDAGGVGELAADYDDVVPLDQNFLGLERHLGAAD